MKDINLEDINLYNLSPSEKLVAILDGELEKSEVGNFFQELYQNNDLQDEFFDMINLKNNFKQTLYAPPSNLKSNILKGAGLIAASTLTYQSIATNNANWFASLWTTIGSKISIALISAVTSALITFGVTDYFNSNNSNSNLTQNDKQNKTSTVIITDNENKVNSNEKLRSNQELSTNEFDSNFNINSNNSSNSNQKYTRKIIANKNIAQTSQFDGNSNLALANENSKNTNSNKIYKNESFDKSIISDEHIYSSNSLISGAVPESRYKVEYISKSNNENIDINNNLNNSINNDINNDAQILDNSNSINNISNNKNNNIKQNEIEIINEDINRSKYIDEQNKLSLHFRNFSAKGINNFTAPQMENPIINNIAAGLLYEINNNWLVGVELGQENFEQEFVAQNGDYKINVQQNYLAFWGGGTVRYRFVNPEKQLTNIQPYVNLFLGSTDRGPLVKPSLGTIYQISNDFSIFGALEYTVLYSKYNAIWYNSQKYGMTYGFIIKL